MKKIRKERAKENYKKDDSKESLLFCVKTTGVTNNNMNMTWVETYREGCEAARNFEERQKRIQPFGPTGFLLDEDARDLSPGYLVYRLCPEMNSFAETKLFIMAGVEYVPPDKRGIEGNSRQITISFGTGNWSEESIRKERCGDRYDLVSDGNLYWLRPRYSDENNTDPKYAEAEATNKIFQEIIDSIRPFIRSFIDGTLRSKGKKPIDCVVSMSDKTLTFAVSPVPGGNLLEKGLSVDSIVNLLNVFLKSGESPEREKISVRFQHKDIETVEGIRFSKGEFLGDNQTNRVGQIAFLLAWKDDFFAVQLTTDSIWDNSRGTDPLNASKAFYDRNNYIANKKSGNAKNTKNNTKTPEPGPTNNQPLFPRETITSKKGESNLFRNLNAPNDASKSTGPSWIDMETLENRYYKTFREQVLNSVREKKNDVSTPENYARLSYNGSLVELSQKNTGRKITYTMSGASYQTANGLLKLFKPK